MAKNYVYFFNLPTNFSPTPLPFATSTKSSARGRRIFGLREIKSEPWTHRENKADVACPSGEVSPIELAIVWVSATDVFDVILMNEV